MSNIVRINFNSSTSIHLHWKSTQALPNWVNCILKEFQIAYGSNFTESYEAYLTSKDGIQYIVKWLKDQGYKAEYWSMEFDQSRGDTIFKITLAYGIEFQEDCEKFVELKLRSST